MAKQTKAKVTVHTAKATTKKGKTTQTAVKSRKKLSEAEQKQAVKRVNLGQKRPIDYYYGVSQTKTRQIEFVEVVQVVNDKFNGTLNMYQYFAIAEQSKRIFELSRMLFEKVYDEEQINPKLKFLVRVSAKYFSTPRLVESLVAQVQHWGERVVLCFDTPTLIRAGEVAKDFIKRVRKDYHTKILLDNPEQENLALIIGYEPDYVRLDARGVDKGNENYTLVLKFLRDYFKAQKIKMVFNNVKDEQIKNYLINNGADVVEGAGVYAPKKTMASIVKDYNL